MAFSNAIVYFLLLGVVHCHMVMNTPVLYSPNKAATWPVTAPGSGLRFPYPCQGMTEVAYRTPITAGSSTMVNFTGSAPHGGGSCQFGLNYHSTESVPYTANPEDYKTIYTIIGGCPAETAGNLETPDVFRGTDAKGNPDSVHCGDDKGLDCIRQFNISFPADLPSGNATFVWTWYNAITRDELYMNCAPVTITGGADATTAPADSAFLNSLPSMFIANIPGFANCTTATTGPHGPFNIPNPGNYGVQLIEPDPAAAGDCPVAPPAPFAGAGAGALLPPASPPVVSSVTTPSTTASLSRSSGFYTILTVPNPTSSIVTVPVITLSATTTTSSTTEQQQPIPATTGTAAGQPEDDGDDEDCGVPGSLVCVSESELGICNGLGQVDVIQLNPEQICVDGLVNYRTSG